jgi:hypothetical protein
MRNALRHTLAICLMAAGLALISAGSASACIAQPGDLRLINRAISAKDTPKADKAKLRQLRTTMLANKGTAPKQVERYKIASRTALDLIGERTVVPHDAAQAAAARANAPKGAPGFGPIIGC